MTHAPAAATRMRVTQRIAADPTSTALLLAGPTACELWPGVRRVAEVDGRIVVETAPTVGDAPERATAACLRALPPQRTPTSYVSKFEWAGPGLPETTAELTLGYAPASDGELGTDASLVLICTFGEPGALDAKALERMARGFLLNLARAAELRNRAA